MHSDKFLTRVLCICYKLHRKPLHFSWFSRFDSKLVYSGAGRCYNIQL